MKKLKTMWNEFVKDESAQGMVEYILILMAVIGFVFIHEKTTTWFFGERFEEC